MKIEGYTLLQQDDLPSCQSVGRLFRHRSGAMVYHLANDDRENSFCFGFATPVNDSKGTPHILEHTVLTGSKKFPLKEPFIDLVKGSVNTFLNAMTYPDKTIYPSASVVKADFFNLLDVYGDAIFFPLLRRECFAQEGHRLEFSPEGELQRSGVVYNEMKGAYSSIDDFAGDWALRALFEQHPYAYDSGGDPAKIPSLSFAEFLDFHRRFYLPSNCLLVLYGNIPAAETLTFVHQRFWADFPAADPQPAQVPLMRPRLQAQRLHKVLERSEDGEPQSMVLLSWLLPEVSDSTTLYGLMLLDEILLGNDASPLRDALTTSKLGEAVSSSSGVVAHLRQPAFICGLRGNCKENLTPFVELVDQTLAQLAQDGLQPDLLRGALQRLEFRQREIKSGFPQGLRLSMAILRGWYYGQSAFDALEFEQSFAWLSQQPPSYFSMLIRRYLVENPHRCELLISTSEQIQPFDEQIPPQWTAAEEAEIRALNHSLSQLQSQPNPPEAVAQLKFLKRHQIPRELTPLRGVYGETGLINWSRHDIFTKGITYLGLGFDLSQLELDQLALLPLFAEGITELGLPGKSYQQVLQQLVLASGRCQARTSNFLVLEGGTLRSNCSLSAAFLPQQRQMLYPLLLELVQHCNWDDHARIEQLLDIAINETRETIIPRGHGFAAIRAQSHLNLLGAVEEKQKGLEQLNSLLEWRSLGVATLAEHMKRLREQLRQAKLTLSLVGENLDWEEDCRWAQQFSQASAPYTPVRVFCSEQTVREGFAIPAPVGYTGVALPGVDYLHPLSPAMHVLAHCLSTIYLWEKVRMEGGAYGAGAMQSGLTQGFVFHSYRDPKFEHSLELFCEGLYAAEKFDAEQIENAVVSLAGRELRPFSPAEEAGDALRYQQMGLSSQLRQQWRDRLLAVSQSEVQAAAQLLIQRWPRRNICVLAAPDRLAKMELDRIQVLSL